MRQNLPGIVIVFSLWLFFSGLGFHLSPESGIVGAMASGLVFAILLCLPVAFFGGLIASLFRKF